MNQWTLDLIPSLKDRTAVITGGSSGIGFEVCRELARKGARTILAGENIDEGIAAVKKLSEEFEHSDITFEALNLANLDSVKNFCVRMRNRLTSLDLLILNAGVASIPERKLSVDDYELIFATNYLGHFALTAQLFHLITETPDARIVSVSSLEHKISSIDFHDINLEKNYDARRAYGQSKLALLMFALELDHRAKDHGLFLHSVAAHPGFSRTQIFDRGPELSGHRYHYKAMIPRLVMKTVAQSAARGALPILMAATVPLSKGGENFGPQGFHELWGPPGRAEIALQALNLKAREKLWQLSEEMSGVRFNFQNFTNIEWQ